VGLGRRFSARDPASPGVACSTLVPRRARLANTQRSGARHPSQCPEAHRPSAPSQYPIAVTARRLDSRHPSQCPEAHWPSVPRARLDASWWRWAACLPSRAERPASQPAGPGSPAKRVSACPGRPPDPQRRGPSPRARSAKHPPPRHSVRPVTDPDPGPRLRHWGLRHWPTQCAHCGQFTPTVHTQSILCTLSAHRALSVHSAKSTSLCAH
jgi:hypothetical protein